NVVVAAGRGKHPPGTPAHRAGQRFVRGCVTRVQGEYQVGRVGQDGAGDGTGDESDLVAEAEPPRQRGIAGALILSYVHTDHGRVYALPAEVPVGGKGEVGVATAQVDDAQRVGKFGGRGQGRPYGTEEGVDLAALGRGTADHLVDRVGGVEQMLALPV